MAVLSTLDLTKVYSRRRVVDRVNFSFRSGEIIGLLGRNGAGKTTTFLMLAGIVKPDEGEVRLDGEVINPITSDERARRGLIYLPQQHSIFTKATVFENLYMMLEMKYSPAYAKARARELTEEFGLLEVSQSRGFLLSGGEKRRLEIARSMIMEPKFLFLDEPFTGIDPITILEIQKVITRLKEKGIGIIITDHNVKDTFYITDRVYIIHQGKLLSEGVPGQVVREEKTRQLFLGYDFQWS